MGYSWGNDGPEEAIRSIDDILRMLDSLMGDREIHWDEFYGDRDKRVPFFANCPDESLAGWFDSGLIAPGQVLELGCGPGRNAIHMAERGCEVDAVDISPVAVEWGEERAREAGVEVNFQCCSIFEFQHAQGNYDLVYDSGCFHHIPPHRRVQFVPLVSRALKPGGLFAIACMGAVSPEEWGGCDASDWQVYRDWCMHGGLGYSNQRLRSIFGEEFDVVELRQMTKCEPASGLFGEPFLWVGLFRKKVQ